MSTKEEVIEKFKEWCEIEYNGTMEIIRGCNLDDFDMVLKACMLRMMGAGDFIINSTDVTYEEYKEVYQPYYKKIMDKMRG